MRRFAVRRSPLCGLHVADDGGLDVEAGEVSESAIGACIQVADFDTERVSRDVRYQSNGANLQATNLPVPEPGEALEALAR